MKKPKIAGKSPIIEKLEQNKKYAWCTCGNSSSQPWCNGAHSTSSFSPMIFEAEESKNAAICLCKQTKNPPYCDGSHTNL